MSYNENSPTNKNNTPYSSVVQNVLNGNHTLNVETSANTIAPTVAIGNHINKIGELVNANGTLVEFAQNPTLQTHKN